MQPQTLYREARQFGSASFTLLLARVSARPDCWGAQAASRHQHSAACRDLCGIALRLLFNNVRGKLPRTTG